MFTISFSILLKSNWLSKPEDKRLTQPGKTVSLMVFDATEIGGAKEDRTPDLLRARQALSQLSYGPFKG